MNNKLKLCLILITVFLVPFVMAGTVPDNTTVSKKDSLKLYILPTTKGAVIFPHASHPFCKGCHKNMGKGPVTCKGCHVRTEIEKAPEQSA